MWNNKNSSILDGLKAKRTKSTTPDPIQEDGVTTIMSGLIDERELGVITPIDERNRENLIKNIAGAFNREKSLPDDKKTVKLDPAKDRVLYKTKDGKWEQWGNITASEIERIIGRQPRSSNVPSGQMRNTIAHVGGKLKGDAKTKEVRDRSGNPIKDKDGNIKTKKVRYRGGHHSQSAFKQMEKAGHLKDIEVRGNGVRIANVSKHERIDKRYGQRQAFFPKEWDDNKIEKAVDFVWDKHRGSMTKTDRHIRDNYDGVWTILHFTGGKLKSAFPDVDQISTKKGVVK